MARKPRVEVEGGLYHVIARGNNRQRIFNSAADYEKFLSLLATQKSKLPFYLYAYCLMTNHVHLLIERQADAIGRVMHRLLTGYAQYYNRRYQRVGHLMQGRHKAILCQSDKYLAELVRYIHLNPVRAGMVERPEHYQYSGHRAYLGTDTAGILDVEPVLRHFGAKKKLARAAYRQFVVAGIGLGHQEEFYLAGEANILGIEEFVDENIHRIGESPRQRRDQDSDSPVDLGMLVEAVEDVCGVRRVEFYGSGKSALSVTAREIFFLIGSEAGASVKQLAEFTGVNSSTVSRRSDAARLKLLRTKEAALLSDTVRKRFAQRRESHKSQA